MPLSNEIRSVVAELDAAAAGHPRGVIPGYRWEGAAAVLLAIATNLREQELAEEVREPAPTQQTSNVIPLVRF
ncbi:hypothetical protein P7L78_09065 [Tistrella bauzanensis]|uniref:hypothetical protein n=1 Tax=Tistrella TaxID=171436 RepID=UPI0031F646B4